LQAYPWTAAGQSDVTLKATTLPEAAAGLRAVLSTGTEVRTIRILLNPKGEDVRPWLDSARKAIPEIRGMMVQGLFARVFRMAGYDVIVGKTLDLFARNRLRSLFVEVKSSLDGIAFGSLPDIKQLEGYLVVSERNKAETWLAIMGLNRPIRLRDGFRAKMRARNIGLLDVRWISADETLTPHFPINTLG
jgi:hypothetical protein